MKEKKKRINLGKDLPEDRFPKKYIRVKCPKCGQSWIENIN